MSPVGPGGGVPRFFALREPESLAAAIERNVRDALAELYPGDRATGYQVGDLRGAVSVKIPLAAGQ